MNLHIKKSNILLLLGITAIILYFILKKEITNILPLLIKANVGWLLGGIGCIIIYWLMESKTLHIMIKSFDQSFPFFEVFKLVVSTQFFNGVTPFASGGQPFQILVLTSRSKMSASNVTSASVHNFMIYQFTLVFMGTMAVICGQIFHLFPIKEGHTLFLAFAGFSLNLLIVIILLIIALSPKLTGLLLRAFFFVLRKTPFKRKLDTITQKVNSLVLEFNKDMLLILNDKAKYFKVFLLNILKFLFLYSVTYFSCRAIGIKEISIIESIVASAYVMLIAAITPSPGASGGAEVGFMFFFGSVISGAEMVAIMLVWRFITYYIGLIIGMITFYFAYSLPAKKTA